MDLHSSQSEKMIYAALVVTALVVRLIGLGHLPLNEAEAGLALQSAGKLVADASDVSSQPGYVALTRMLFTLFGTSDFLARFWPVLIGSFLVVVPFYFKKYLGSKEALLLAAILVFDPAGLVLSRQAGGDMLAVSGLALTAANLSSKRYKSAGFWLGIALLGGISVWYGLLILLVSAVALGWLGIQGKIILTLSDGVKNAGKALLLFAVGTFLLIGTLLFFYPSNLGGFGGSLGDLLSGFASPEPFSIKVIIIVALTYYLPGIILGAWQGLDGIIGKNKVDQALLVVFGVSLLWVIVYPGRSVGDLIWLSIPLWALSARKVIQLANISMAERTSVFAHVFLVVVLAGFIWLNLSGYVLSIGNAASEKNRLVAIIISVVLLILTTVLVGWGWTWRTAGKALTLGFCLFLTVYGLGASLRAAGYGDKPCHEPWRDSPCFTGTDYLVRTIQDTSEWNFKSRTGIDIGVVGVQPDALLWSLRNYPGVKQSIAFPTLNQPSLLITDNDEINAPPEGYLGQDFVIMQKVDWKEIFEENYLAWLVNRKVASEDDLAILWVRNGLFPGSIEQNY